MSSEMIIEEQINELNKRINIEKKENEDESSQSPIPNPQSPNVK